MINQVNLTSITLAINKTITVNNYWFNKLGTRVIACLDSRAFSRPTIRHVECRLLLAESSKSDRCEKCTMYRKTLNKALSRKRQDLNTDAPHSHTNHRYLSSPEKVAKIKQLQHTNRMSQKRIVRLTQRFEELTARSGVCLDDGMSNDLKTIIKEEDKSVLELYPKDSFLYLFWQHQKEALSKNPKGMRWHPLMIRWCLFLRHQSSKAYDGLRDSGIALPSQRTLRDYTHHCKAATGFSKEVDEQLVLASRILTCDKWQTYVVVLVDEMYIRYGKY